MAVENPEAPGTDMGRSSFQMPRIRRAFEHAHRVLLYAVAAPNLRSILSLIIRVDDEMLSSRVRINITGKSKKEQRREATGLSSGDAATALQVQEIIDSSNNEASADEIVEKKSKHSKKRKRRHDED